MKLNKSGLRKQGTLMILGTQKIRLLGLVSSGGGLMGLCTMTIQVEIPGKKMTTYEKNRDKFVRKLHEMGCDVTIEDDGEEPFEDEDA